MLALLEWIVFGVGSVAFVIFEITREIRRRSAWQQARRTDESRLPAGDRFGTDTLS